MIFSLDVRRARKGDCLLLHFGSKEKPGLVMIDGGPKQVYAPHLKPRLDEIRAHRKLKTGTRLPVDVLMVSHVDDDHIQGILDLTRDLLTHGGKDQKFLQVARFWHNSFDDIIGNTPSVLTAAVTAGFGAAALNGEFSHDEDLDLGTDEHDAADTLGVLASIEQGHRLRGDAEVLGFPLNPEFDEGLIIASKEKHEVAEGLTFLVAGPMKAELLALQEKHDEWLKEQKKKKLTGKAALAAYVDRSVPNLSSIVVLAEFGKKRILLTGDARGDKILKGLELAKAMPAGGSLEVDILKCPHHGSSNNVGPDFFRRIAARHYVFSGDGEHGNPERETLEMLLKARKDKPFTIHLTYPIDEIDAGRKADWNKEREKEKKRKAAGTTTKVPREAWSPQKHGLKAFLKGAGLRPDQKISVAEEGKPHVIDLLDALDF